MDDEVERMWKKAVEVLFKVLSQYLPGRPEKNKEKAQSG